MRWSKSGLALQGGPLGPPFLLDACRGTRATTGRPYGTIQPGADAPNPVQNPVPPARGAEVVAPYDGRRKPSMAQRAPLRRVIRHGKTRGANPSPAGGKQARRLFQRRTNDTKKGRAERAVLIRQYQPQKGSFRAILR